MKLITNEPKPQSDPLEDLARQADGLGAAASAEATAENDDQALAMAAIEAKAAKVVLGLLKAARSYLAKRLPEILEEWPDEVLKEPANAAIPLLRKHMEALMKLAGANPELAVLVMSLLPLVTGWVEATAKHSRNASKPEPEIVNAA